MYSAQLKERINHAVDLPRHTKACTAKRAQHDRAFWKCKCLIYAEESTGGEYIRQSLNTRSRGQANRRILKAEARGSWNVQTDPVNILRGRTIADAIGAFLEDAPSSKGANSPAQHLASTGHCWCGWNGSAVSTR